MNNGKNKIIEIILFAVFTVMVILNVIPAVNSNKILSVIIKVLGAFSLIALVSFSTYIKIQKQNDSMFERDIDVDDDKDDKNN